MEKNFSPADYLALAEHEIDLNTVAAQYTYIKNGIPTLLLNRPAILNDGILGLTEVAASDYATFFDDHKNKYAILKFVPASGAASRMFKFLTEFLQNFNANHQTINDYIKQNNDRHLELFLASLTKFPFYKTVHQLVQKVYPNYKKFDSDMQNYVFIKTMLSTDQLNYANQPKGILPFHTYGQKMVTAIEEHVKECSEYAATNGKAFLHLTISEQHQAAIENVIQKCLENGFTAIDLEVSYSYQRKNTDVIAYDLYNKPLIDSSNNLVFRPGGHGALIENLNQLNADIIFIKNVDNVLVNQSSKIVVYKKALAGILIEYQNTIFEYVKALISDVISDDKLQEIIGFVKSKLFLTTISDINSIGREKVIEALLKVLNRPIRICGMVKNEGEAGGGPFWVADSNGNFSLQIIEASQIDVLNKTHQKMIAAATHFNPVDLVCGIKNCEGNKFNLTDFVDNTTGFIVHKTKNGMPYKAFELPGLWNGAMANWITVFVEVPISTFSPVKTVNDLLKPEHQAVN